MKSDNGFLADISTAFIKDAYQQDISPLLTKKFGIRCRFHPSCSNYGKQAIEKHGFVQGWLKTMWRIARCNPYNTGSCVDYP